jgi:hypothetical protein
MTPERPRDPNQLAKSILILPPATLDRPRKAGHEARESWWPA